MQLLRELMDCSTHLKELLDKELAQGTIEFALVFAGVLAILVALFQLAQAASHGLFLDQAINCTAHQLQSSIPGIIGDVFLH